MKKMPCLPGIIVLCAVCSSCSTVPLTGRSQIDLVPAETMLSLSSQQYEDFLRSNRLSTSQAQTSMVKTTGQNIRRAVERYMAENNMSAHLKNYSWEFSLVEDPAINAWCMPGGKVVVYTGILPVTRNEEGLAVVLSHEIAHAIARHGNERLSQGMISQLGVGALSAALRNKPEQTRQLWMTVFNAGAEYGVLLPYSRLQESEADYLGLVFMAKAGYDPRAAIAFWERMAALKGSKISFEFLSTHPSDQVRIRDIKARLPEVMKFYRKD